LKVNIKISVIIILCLQFIFVSAQNNTDSTKARIDKAYIKSYFVDVKDIAISPLHWNKNEIISATATAGIGALLYFNDEQIQGFFQRNRTNAVDEISKYGFSNWGNGYYTIPALGLLYICGAANDNESNKKTALLATKAFVISGGFAYMVKLLSHRYRPDDNIPGDAYIWDGPSLDFDHLSFFSGHSVTVFSVATVIASEYKEKIIIPIIVYSVAGLTSISRVYDNRHWASDVFIGAVLGYATGKLIYNKNNWGIDVKPYSDYHSSGISLIYNFNK